MVNHYPVWPPTNGGKIRILNLARPLSKYFDITILCMMGIRDVVMGGQHKRMITLEDKIKEIDVSGGFLKSAILSPLYLLGYNCVDSFSSKRILSMGPFAAQLREAMRNADILMMEHPYVSQQVARAIRNDSSGIGVVYDAIDTELIYSMSQNRGYLLAPIINRQVWNTERMACDISKAIFTTNDQDCEALRRIYKISDKTILTIPIGIDTEAIRPPSEAEKREAKKMLGIGEGKLVITYHASSALHNVKVLNRIMSITSEFAQTSRNVVFYIVGSIVSRINHSMPQNSIFGRFYAYGDPYIGLVLKATDIALSLDVGHKTGTPVKTLEYMAYGLPVVVTADESIRAGLTDGLNARVTSLKEVSRTLKDLVKEADTREKLGKEARRFIKQRYDMMQCGEQAAKSLKSLIAN